MVKIQSFSLHFQSIYNSLCITKEGTYLDVWYLVQLWKPCKWCQNWMKSLCSSRIEVLFLTKLGETMNSLQNWKKCFSSSPKKHIQMHMPSLKLNLQKHVKGWKLKLMPCLFRCDPLLLTCKWMPVVWNLKESPVVPSLFSEKELTDLFLSLFLIIYH